MSSVAIYHGRALLITVAITTAVVLPYYAASWLVGWESSLTVDYWAGFFLGHWVVRACNRERFEP